ncbi:hypothetical protein DMENIID0001_022030 [Sergentomyia squamirostris]
MDKTKVEISASKLESIDEADLESFRNILSSRSGSKNINDEINNSDDEVSAGVHRKLLSAIEKIDRTQHIRVPTRTEISTKESEFHVVKSRRSAKPQEKFTFHQLTNVPKKSSEAVAKDLKKLSQSKKKLAKPLEKPVAERISRGIAYEKARIELDRWEPVVQKNRFDDCLIFPQNPTNEMTIEEDATEQSAYRIKSDLMLELEALEAKRPGKQVESKKNSQEAEKKLSKKELQEQQKELARLRRKESYEIEKARRQKKIKSKKYHKVLKKEKIKKQLAEFEILQKTDPEEALRRLELIEKNRVAERSHLRHRNTGTWAKSLQIRAKFDKDARKDLSEQLAIGRELKQQKQTLNSDGESENEDEKGKDERDDDYDPFDPWEMKKKEENGDEILGGYRKYWNERNRNEQKKREYDALPIAVSEVSNDDVLDVKPVKSIKKSKKKASNLAWTVEDIDESDVQLSTISQPLSVQKKIGRKTKKRSIDELFDSAEQKMSQEITEKLSKIQEKMKKTEKSTRLSKKQNKNHLNLALKKNSQRPVIDEALEETTQREDPEINEDFSNLKKVLSSKTDKNPQDLAIAPDSYATVETKVLRTAVPDIVFQGDEDDAIGKENGKMSLMEALEDDDIFTDFTREKADQIAADQPKDIDLTLPGWGSWTGDGVKKKTKRMVLKFPKNIPRKDSNKDSVIINEAISDKTKNHLVRDLPFPFTSVRDFEASIRAPIGRTFVPETAHRVLTKPALITKMGTIIEPMDEKVLLNGGKPERPKTKTAQRILEIFNKDIATKSKDKIEL